MPTITPNSSSVPFNRLLAALPASEYADLLKNLKPMALVKGDVLYEPDEPIKNVYFPITGVVSIVAQLRKGASVEVGIVGKEGMVGLPTFLGADSIPHKTFVQVPGSAWRMKVDVLKTHLHMGGSLDGMLRRFANFYMMQISQTAACNSQHRIENRCARWLLSVRDRMGSDEFPLTQEYLSQMLAVRRATVAHVASTLQSAGLIRYRYGRITILDPTGLERASCECHRKVKVKYDGLFD